MSSQFFSHFLTARVLPYSFSEKHPFFYSSSISTTLPNFPMIFALLFHKSSHNSPSFTSLKFFPQFPVAHPLTLFHSSSSSSSHLFLTSLSPLAHSSSSKVFSHFLTTISYFLIVLTPLPHIFPLFLTVQSVLPLSLSPFHSSSPTYIYLFFLLFYQVTFTCCIPESLISIPLKKVTTAVFERLVLNESYLNQKWFTKDSDV